MPPAVVEPLAERLPQLWHRLYEPVGARYTRVAPEPLCIQNRPIIHHRINEIVY